MNEGWDWRGKEKATTVQLEGLPTPVYGTDIYLTTTYRDLRVNVILPKSSIHKALRSCLSSLQSIL